MANKDLTVLAFDLGASSGRSIIGKLKNNILVQALALDKIENVSELRKIVRSSFPIKEYLPKETNKWEKAYNSYFRIIEP